MKLVTLITSDLRGATAIQLEARPELKGLAHGELAVFPLVLDVHTRRIAPV